MFVVALGLTALLTAAPAAHATAGINNQINYQARLLNTAGATVPDGSYNLEFKIYHGGTGCVSSGSSPCGGTLDWTEDWLNNNTQGVTVTNGYFSVNLGAGSDSVALSTLNFNQTPLWLSVNVGNTNGSCATFGACSGDGEMLPFTQFAAAPYAFDASQVGGISASGLVQLSVAQQTGNISVSGTGTFSGASALTLGSSSNAASILFEDGAHSTGVTLTVASTATPYSLTLPTVGPTTSQCLQSGAVTAALLVFGSCSGGGSTLQADYNASSGNTITLTDARDLTFTAADTATDPNVVINLQCVTSCGANGRFAIQSGGTDVFKVSPNGGAALFKNSVNSTTGLQVQNSGGGAILTVDTTGGNQNNLITTLTASGTPSFENSTTGWTGVGGCTLSAVTSATSSPAGNVPFNGSYSGQCSNTATIGAEYKYITGNSPGLNSSTVYTLDFDAKVSATPGTVLNFGHVENGGGEDVAGLSLTSQTVLSNGWTHYSLTFKTGAAAAQAADYLYIKQNDGTARSLWIDGVTLQTDPNADNNYREGKVQEGGVVTSPLTLQNASNSNTAFQVQNAAGASVFTVSTDDTNLMPNPGAEVNAAGWTAKGSGTIIRDTSQQKFGVASFKITTTAANNDGAQYTGLSLPIGNYSIGLSVKLSAGAFAANALQAGITNGGGDIPCTLAPAVSASLPSTTGWTRFTCTVNVTTTAGTAFFIRDNDSATHTFWVDGVELDSGLTLTPYGVGGISVNAVVNTPLTLQNQSDSTNALTLYNFNGNMLFNVDTLNSTLNLGATGAVAQASTINIATSTGATQIVNIGSAGSGTAAAGTLVNIQGGTTAATAVTIGTNGAGGITVDTGTTGSILVGAGTGSGKAIQIGPNATNTNTTTYQIGANAAGTQTIAIGSTAVGATANANTTVSIQGGTAANAISIGTTAAVNQVTIGSTNTTSNTTIQGGTGNINLSTNNASAGVIDKTSTNSATALEVTNSTGDNVAIFGTNPSVTNYMANGGLETGVATGWTGVNTGTAAINSTVADVYQGTYSLKMTTPAGGDGVKNTNFNGTVPSGTYEFSFWFLYGSATFGLSNFTITLNDGSSHACTLDQSANTGNATGWVLVSCHATTTANLSFVQITAPVGGGATFYFDDFSLTTAATYVPYNSATTQLWNQISSPILIQGTNSSQAFVLNNASGQNQILVDTQGSLNTGNNIDIGSVALASGTQNINIGATNTAGGTTNVSIGCYTTCTAGTTLIQSKGTFTLQSGTGSISLGATTSVTSTGALSILPTTNLTVESASGSTFIASSLGAGVSQLGNAGSGLTEIGNATGSTNLTGPLYNTTSKGVCVTGTIGTCGAITATPVLLDLDQSSLAAPETAGNCTTAINAGGLYYSATAVSGSTTTQEIRGCVNGKWTDVVTGDQLGIMLLGVEEGSGTTVGDISGIAGYTSSPCKVTWTSITTVTVAPCTAYSGGRKVVIGSATVVTTAGTASSTTFQHVCLSGTNGAPVATAANTVETAAVPAWSAASPILCLATVKLNTTPNISNIYDTRVFVTSTKEYATSSTAVAPGMVEVIDTTGTANTNKTVAVAQTVGARGIVAVGNTAGSTTTINSVIVVGGPAFAKATGVVTLAQAAQTSGTAGYVQSAASVGGYKDIGQVLDVGSTGACSAATNCQFSVLIDTAAH